MKQCLGFLTDILEPARQDWQTESWNCLQI